MKAERAVLRKVGNVVCDGVEADWFLSGAWLCTGGVRRQRHIGSSTRRRRVYWAMCVQAARCTWRGRKDVQEAHGFNTSRLRARRRRVVHVCEKFFLAIYGNK